MRISATEARSRDGDVDVTQGRITLGVIASGIAPLALAASGCSQGGLELVDGLPREDLEPAELVATLHDAFSNLTLRREVFLTSGNSAASLFLFEGTHDGELWSFEPTGRPVSIVGGEVVHINRQGEITKAVYYLDQATMLAQIGARGPGRRGLARPRPRAHL